MSKLLDGIKILDFSRGYMGGFATMLLADFGATVIKVELPEGDYIRNLEPKNEKGSAYHAYINRGKKSICVDYTTKNGHDVILELVKSVDVVCDNFAAGEMESWNLGYETLKEANDTILYASLTAFGKTGPLSYTGGMDLMAQALSGLMGITGFPGTLPTAHGSRMGEQYGGIYLAYAIVLGIIAKKNIGKGQCIDVSAADCLFTALEGGEITCSIKGRNFEHKGNLSQMIAPYDTFQAKDGYFSTAVSTNPQWSKFCEAMEMEYLLEDPRFTSNALRGKNYINGLRPILEEKFSTMTRAEIEEKLRPFNVPCGPVLSAGEAMKHEQLNTRNMIVSVEDPMIGTIEMPGIPIKISGEDDKNISGAPRLGEDTQKYIREAGYDQETIEEFCRQGILRMNGGDRG